MRRLLRRLEQVIEEALLGRLRVTAAGWTATLLLVVALLLRLLVLLVASLLLLILLRRLLLVRLLLVAWLSCGLVTLLRLVLLWASLALEGSLLLLQLCDLRLQVVHGGLHR